MSEIDDRELAEDAGTIVVRASTQSGPVACPACIRFPGPKATVRRLIVTPSPVEFEGDTGSGVLVLTAYRLDPGRPRWRGGGGLTRGC